MKTDGRKICFPLATPLRLPEQVIKAWKAGNESLIGQNSHRHTQQKDPQTSEV